VNIPFFSSHGVLGLNARNLLYIKPFNPRRAVAFADDKLRTKAYLSARGIPAARLYARIESRRQLYEFDFDALPEDCVLKPNAGFGGEGILVLRGRRGKSFLRQGKVPIDQTELEEHILDILDGRYAITGLPDSAFFEQLLTPDACFAPLRPAGLPDIRIVVFNLVPVMAMLRIPTIESQGKANVHLGGIGIGIDIAKGTTTFAAQYNRIVNVLPHGGSPAGIPIPRWDELLLIASRIQQLTNIGYLAVDLTIDAENGPMLLEVNARAGLMVQVANLAPLRSRLERVEGLKLSSPEKGVRLAQELFGEKISGTRSKRSETRTVLGMREVLHISGEGVNVDVPCFVDPQRDFSIFEQALLDELLQAGAVEEEERPAGSPRAFRVKWALGGVKRQTLVHTGEMPSTAVRAVIGRRDLTGFLLDPSRGASVTPVRTSTREDARAIDRLLARVDHDLLLLPCLKPLNLREELGRAQHDLAYNPVFHYAALRVDLDDVERRLNAVAPDDSPIGVLLARKRDELLIRVELLRARGEAQRFTAASQSLIGCCTDALIADAKEHLRVQIACDLPPSDADLLDAEEIVPMLDEALCRYALHDWQVVVRQNIVADCTVGAHRIYVRKGARFTKARVEALIAHEIEAHVLTAENGAHQPFELFRRGFAHYLDTQEGLAIFTQERVLSPGDPKRTSSARSALAVAHALTHSFADTRRYLIEELGERPEKALSKTIDVKRGLGDTSRHGAFTKGVVYFRGWKMIRDFVANKGDLRRVYIGKIALEDLELAERVAGMKPPVLLPQFLRPEKEKR
jgi:alpha-L-glutamate ligase-like protein/uncharacterized protein (TIGR02421 family)